MLQTISEDKGEMKLRTRWLTMMIMWTINFGLLCLCMWEGRELWSLNSKLNSMPDVNLREVNAYLSDLKKEFKRIKENLIAVEEKALWRENEDLVSWVTEQTNGMGAQIVGVEYAGRRKVDGYIYTSMKFTLRGDYHPLSRFVNRLERSGYPFFMDFISISKSPSGSLILTLILSRVERKWPDQNI